MNEWISVEFGVPDHEVQVLTWSELDGFAIGDLHDMSDGSEGWLDELGDQFWPTHWITLPEPPKESAE